MIDASTKAILDEALATSTPRDALIAMLNVADSYNQAAQLSLNHIEITSNADFLAPALMCRSFAIELLLKLLISAEDASAGMMSAGDLKNKNLPPRGHQYSVLFDGLNKDTKKMVAKHFEKVSGEQTSDHRFRELLKSTGDNPFVEWRYAHEIIAPKFLNLDLLTKLCDALGLSAVTALEARSKRI